MDVFCIDSVDIDTIECIRDPCLVSTVSTYIVLMVWLKSPESQLSKTFCGLKMLRYRSNKTLFSRIELISSIVLSSRVANYKNDIQ